MIKQYVQGKCPFCDKNHSSVISEHLDGFGYSTDKILCPHCGKMFYVTHDETRNMTYYGVYLSDFINANDVEFNKETGTNDASDDYLKRLLRKSTTKK